MNEQTQHLKELLERVSKLEKLIHEQLVPELDDQDKRLDAVDTVLEGIEEKMDLMLKLQGRTQFDPLLLQSIDKKLDATMADLRAHIAWEESGRPVKLGEK